MSLVCLQRRLLLAGAVAVACSAMTKALGAAAAPGVAEARARAAATRVPKGYVAIGLEQSVPPLLLFSVALQESEMRFGARRHRRILPWPWTLNVRGAPRRYQTQEDATAALLAVLHKGITVVDIGLMQLCWHYHGERFESAHVALEPYTNLRVGAALLRGHYNDTQSWFAAVGRYHAPGDPARAARYASSVMQRLKRTLNA